MPFWKIAGPGAVLLGLSIGAGEIIIWPRLVAQHGTSMVWAAVIGVFLQQWINLEIGRWTIATGETIFTAYFRAWRGFAPLFILLTLVGWIAPGSHQNPRREHQLPTVFCFVRYSGAAEEDYQIWSYLAGSVSSCRYRLTDTGMGYFFFRLERMYDLSGRLK